MAKKRHTKKAAPVKKGGSIGWLIAAIVVIVIIAFMVMKPAKETAKEVVKEVEEGALVKAAAPEFDKKCTIAGGVIPGTKSVVGNVVTVTYKNTGKIANEGTYFEFKAADGTKIYRKNTKGMAPMESVVYTVDLNDVATELGSMPVTFAIFPIQSGKPCLNQPAYVIK